MQECPFHSTGLRAHDTRQGMLLTFGLTLSLKWLRLTLNCLRLIYPALAGAVNCQMKRIRLPSGVSEMKDLHRSFADFAGPRKRGAPFHRQQNKLLSGVKLRLRYRLSLLQSIRNRQSKSRNAAIAISACMQPRSDWILRIQSSYSRYVPLSAPSS
jgi:hypothetical protein